MRFTIIIVAYKRYNPLRCLLFSLLSQTYQNFDVIIIHDGADEGYGEIVHEFMEYTNIRFYSSHERYNDWGHSLRNIGLSMAKGDFIINTNDDNYYTPNYLQELNDTILNNPGCNFVYYDMILSHNNTENHNHKDYGLFLPRIQHSYMDVGQFAIKRDTIDGHKFGTNADADGTLIEEIKTKLIPVYINKVLFVHN